MLPTSLVKNESGDCAAVPVTPVPKSALICSKGFASFIDNFRKGNSWRADDVYQAMILVESPTDLRHKAYVFQKYTSYQQVKN